MAANSPNIEGGSVGRQAKPDETPEERAERVSAYYDESRPEEGVPGPDLEEGIEMKDPDTMFHKLHENAVKIGQVKKVY